MRAEPQHVRSTLRRFAAFALAAVILATALGDTAEAKRPLLTGFVDSRFRSPEDGVREEVYRDAVAAGAGIVRVGVNWADVAPSRVARQADPGAPGYEWDGIDDAVRAAAARRLPVMFSVGHAPGWAEGPNPPAGANPGTWKPNAVAFGRFGHALAKRYSGDYPDPERPGQMLPRVRFFEAWNEPNLNYYFAPQWVGKRLVGPALYKRLLNRFYRGVHLAQRDARVIAPATAPYGDLPGGERTPPVQFLRRLLCLHGGKLRPLRCKTKARFDVLSHHPINSVAGPRRKARNPLDASTPDIGRLTRVLRKAERLRLVLPRGRRRAVWGTELWWETDPPDPVLGIPLARQARYMNIAQYVLWQQGVSVAIFLPLIDYPRGDNVAETLQSGVYFADGRPKPALAVTRFPFVVQRTRGSRAIAWGRAPRRSRVRIQRRAGKGWRTIATARGRPGRPFRVRIRLRGSAVLRASADGATSRPMRLRVHRR